MALSQRRRLLDAIVAAVAENGYATTTVAHVIKRAGVSRTTFYQHFADKEECFLAAYEQAAGLHFAQVQRAQADAEGGVREKLRAGVTTYVTVLARQPASARAFLGEIVAAGPRALALRERFQRRYVDLLLGISRELRSRQPGAHEVDDEMLLGLTTAIDDMIVRRVRNGGIDDPGELARKAEHMLTAVLGLYDTTPMRPRG